MEPERHAIDQSGNDCPGSAALPPNTAGQLLKHCQYSLRVNRKSIAETQHPARNRQFELIADFRKRFEDASRPILSLDAKKKELIGNFRNAGQTWKKEPEQVNQHDFRSHALARVSPYGLYEPVRDRGTIVIGTSADTPEFAVDCLDRWIAEFGWTTKTGLKVKALLNKREYAKGKAVPDHLFKTIPLSNHSELPAWNYTIRPN